MGSSVALSLQQLTDVTLFLVDDVEGGGEARGITGGPNEKKLQIQNKRGLTASPLVVDDGRIPQMWTDITHDILLLLSLFFTPSNES